MMFLARTVLVAAALASPARGTSHDDVSTCDAFDQGECVHRTPQARALLQVTKMAPIALFEGRGGALKNFQELERRVHEMRAEGHDPIGIQGWIQQQLLPMANVTKSELQGEVNRAQQAVDNCAAQLAAAEDGARGQETILSIGETRHNECEVDSTSKSKKAEDNCAGVDGLIKSLEAPPSVATVDLNSTEAVEDALLANVRFFEESYPKYMDEDKQCSTATEIAAQQKQMCQVDKSHLEASFCSLRKARKHICSDYDACFAEKTALFARVVADVKAVEAHTKSSFQTLTCFSHTIMAEMMSERPPCNTSTVDASSLDVFYPSQPQKESCSSEVSTSRNYSAALCGEEAGAAAEAKEAEAENAEEAFGNASSANASIVVALEHKASSADKLEENDGKNCAVACEAMKKQLALKQAASKSNYSDSVTAPPPSCEPFCVGDCPCLIPWAERCLLNSCGDCATCATLTTLAPR